MNRLRVGDQVMVVAGRDKGRTGEVLKVRDDGKCLVRGIQMVSKTVRPDPDKGVEGGIVRREAAIDVSNIALVDPSTGKPSRVGYKVDDSSKKKVRYFRSSGNLVDGDSDGEAS